MVACFAAGDDADRRRRPDRATSASSLLVIGVVVLLAVLIEPYRMERLTGFLNPGARSRAAPASRRSRRRSRSARAGIFGVGLGESLQKAFYLPEAHTDMIAAVIGEELGLVGIGGLVCLYGLFGYAGLRIAQNARATATASCSRPG